MNQAHTHYHVTQDVPLVGLKRGDLVIYDPHAKGVHYTLHRALIADTLLVQTALDSSSIRSDPPGSAPAETPARVLPMRLNAARRPAQKRKAND